MDSQDAPTLWSHPMHAGTNVPMQSWHEFGGPENSVTVGYQRFFLSRGVAIRP